MLPTAVPCRGAPLLLPAPIDYVLFEQLLPPQVFATTTTTQPCLNATRHRQLLVLILPMALKYLLFDAVLALVVLVAHLRSNFRALSADRPQC